MAFIASDNIILSDAIVNKVANRRGEFLPSKRVLRIIAIKVEYK
jgi:hypothetical protein